MNGIATNGNTRIKNYFSGKQLTTLLTLYVWAIVLWSKFMKNSNIQICYWLEILTLLAKQLACEMRESVEIQQEV